MGQAITFVPVDTQDEALTLMKNKHKSNGAMSLSVVLDDKYILSIPTRDKPDYKFIKDQTNCAKQLISKEKTKDRLRRKLEERKSAN